MEVCLELCCKSLKQQFSDFLVKQILFVNVKYTKLTVLVNKKRLLHVKWLLQFGFHVIKTGFPRAGPNHALESGQTTCRKDH